MEVHLIDDCNCSCSNHPMPNKLSQNLIPNKLSQNVVPNKLSPNLGSLDDYQTPGVRIVYLSQ